MDDDSVTGIDRYVIYIITGGVEYQVSRLQFFKGYGLGVFNLISGGSSGFDAKVLEDLLNKSGAVSTLCK